MRSKQLVRVVIGHQEQLVIEFGFVQDDLRAPRQRDAPGAVGNMDQKRGGDAGLRLAKFKVVHSVEASVSML